MQTAETLTATVLKMGQVILPKAICKAFGWDEGLKLIVEDAPEDVLLKPLPVFARTRDKDVFGCLAFGDVPKTVAEMRIGVLAEAKQRQT